MSNTSSHKCCSVCGCSFPLEEFTYGNRENRSYCGKCNAMDKQAYAQGGAEAARAFREGARAIWKGKGMQGSSQADA